MNLLVAGGTQVLLEEGWLERLNITCRDTGNALDQAGVEDFSARVDIQALRAYRLAVGRRTRQVVRQLEPAQLKHKPSPEHLRRITEQGAVVEAASGLIDYWASCTFAGLLLMPPTRHNFIHLNEAVRVKQKR